MDEKIPLTRAREMLLAAGYETEVETNRLAVRRLDSIGATFCYFYQGPPGQECRVSSQAVKKLVNKAMRHLPPAGKINRPLMRELAKRAGYRVHQRSCHGPGPAYDWSPKSTMESRHFRSEEEAWKDVEESVHRKLSEGEKLIRLVEEIIREG